MRLIPENSLYYDRVNDFAVVDGLDDVSIMKSFGSMWRAMYVNEVFGELYVGFLAEIRTIFTNDDGDLFPTIYKMKRDLETKTSLLTRVKEEKIARGLAYFLGEKFYFRS